MSQLAADRPAGWPPRPGDVWRDTAFTFPTDWRTRAAADGRPEFFEPTGPGFVPADDLPKFRGALSLVKRDSGFMLEDGA